MAIVLKDVHIGNSPAGIVAHNTDITVENATFDNVAQPYQITGSGSASISNSQIRNGPKHFVANGGNSKSSVGWSPPVGPALPAFCPHCKAVFASKNYNITVPRFLTKNSIETCPECQEFGATLADGIYDLS